jgi:hypothetical protein
LLPQRRAAIAENRFNALAARPQKDRRAARRHRTWCNYVIQQLFQGFSRAIAFGVKDLKGARSSARMRPDTLP